VKDGVVLDFRCDDVIALGAQLFESALQHPVVGLGAAAGEENFLGQGVQRGRHLSARLIYGGAALGREGIHGGRIPVKFREIRRHHFQYLWIGRRRCRVVEINVFHCVLLP